MEALQNTTSLLLLPPMPQGKAVTEDVQWIVIRLSATMAPGDIAAYTDLSERKVKDIIHHFAQTEDVNIPVRERPRLQKSLRDEDIQVNKHNNSTCYN